MYEWYGRFFLLCWYFFFFRAKLFLSKVERVANTVATVVVVVFAVPGVKIGGSFPAQGDGEQERENVFSIFCTY